MNQLKNVEALLEDLQVPFTVEVHDGGKTLIIKAWSGTRVTGYPGLTAEFNFTNEGDFVEFGVWK